MANIQSPKTDFSNSIVNMTYYTAEDKSVNTLPGSKVLPSQKGMESSLPDLLKTIAGGEPANHQILSNLKPPITNLKILEPMASQMIESSIQAELPKLSNSENMQSFLSIRNENMGLLEMYRNALIGG